MAQCLYVSLRADSALLRVLAESGYRCRHVAAALADAAWLDVTSLGRDSL